MDSTLTVRYETRVLVYLGIISWRVNVSIMSVKTNSSFSVTEVEIVLVGPKLDCQRQRQRKQRSLEEEPR